MQCKLHPVQIICIEMQTCQNTWGQGLCIAPQLPTQENLKPCFNTWSTCKNKQQLYTDGGVCDDGNQVSGFSCGSTRYYFSTCEIPKELRRELEADGVYLGPVVREKTIQFKTGYLSLTQQLSTKATLSLDISDFDHNDELLDPYLEQRSWFRINDATAKPSGTFWGRFIARNKHFKNKPLSIYRGDCTESFSEFKKNTFIVDSLQLKQGHATVNASDPLNLFDEIDNKCPQYLFDIGKEPITLNADIDETFNGPLPIDNIPVTEELASRFPFFTWIPIGIPVGLTLCIGKETVSVYVTIENSDLDADDTDPRWCGVDRVLTVPADGITVRSLRASKHSEGAKVLLPFQSFVSSNFYLNQQRVTETTLLSFYELLNPVSSIVQNLLRGCTNLRNLLNICCSDDEDGISRLIASPPCEMAGKTVLCDVTICQQEKVGELLKELSQQFGFRLFYNSDNQQIEYIPNKPACNIIHFESCLYEDKSFKTSVKNRKRVNQINWFYGVVDPTEGMNDPENYESICVTIDTDSSDCLGDNEFSAIDIFSRWTCDASKFMIECESRRMLKRLSCDTTLLEFNLSAAALEEWDGIDDVAVGQYFTIDSCYLQDECGEQSDESGRTVFQINQLTPVGDCIKVKAESTEFNSNDCWYTALCEEEPTDCGQALPIDPQPVLIEANNYACTGGCKIY